MYVLLSDLPFSYAVIASFAEVPAYTYLAQLQPGKKSSIW